MSSTFPELISYLISITMSLGALVTLIYILIGGFSYLTAGGNTEKVEEARGIILNAFIGLTVIASAFVLFRLLSSLFGFIPIDYSNIPSDYNVPIAAFTFVVFLLLFIPPAAITINYILKRRKEKIVKQIRESEKDLFKSIENRDIAKVGANNAE